MSNQPEHVKNVLDSFIQALEKRPGANFDLIEKLKTLRGSGELADKAKLLEVLASLEVSNES